MLGGLFLQDRKRPETRKDIGYGRSPWEEFLPRTARYRKIQGNKGQIALALVSCHITKKFHLCHILHYDRIVVLDVGKQDFGCKKDRKIFHHPFR